MFVSSWLETAETAHEANTVPKLGVPQLRHLRTLYQLF